MKLQINQSGITYYVELDKIIYCKAERSYCIIFLLDEKEILCSKSLRKLAELLNYPNFVRIHNSYLININFVKKYVRCREHNCVIISNNNIKLPIARNRNHIFQEAMIKLTL